MNPRRAFLQTHTRQTERLHPIWLTGLSPDEVESLVFLPFLLTVRQRLRHYCLAPSSRSGEITWLR